MEIEPKKFDDCIEPGCPGKASLIGPYCLGHMMAQPDEEETWDASQLVAQINELELGPDMMAEPTVRAILKQCENEKRLLAIEDMTRILKVLIGKIRYQNEALSLYSKIGINRDD